MIKSILIILLLSINLFFGYKGNNSKLINEMFHAIKNIQSIQFKLKDYERINEEIKEGEEDVKILYSPFKIYIYVHAPDEGVEVLWSEGENNNKAYVHPNGFPYITLNLDPYGDIMASGHHTIFELNLNYISGIISDLKEKSGEKFEEYLQYEGDIIFDNKKCYKITINNPNFKYISYTIQKGENIRSIARKFHISEYMILEKNPDIESYDKAIQEKVITIPTSYCSKAILYIEHQSKLPLVQTMYDEKGIFEKYEIYDFKLNPKFTDKDFSKNNHEYHF